MALIFAFSLKGLAYASLVRKPEREAMAWSRGRVVFTSPSISSVVPEYPDRSETPQDVHQVYCVFFFFPRPVLTVFGSQVGEPFRVRRQREGRAAT